MKLLLDTHVVLWAWGDPERISARARDAILDPANVKVVSAASAWEASVKSAAGRLDLPEDFADSIARQRLRSRCPSRSRKGWLPGHCTAPTVDAFDGAADGPSPDW